MAMKKSALVLGLLVKFLFAQSITAGYDVSFGIFGEIGKAEISYIHEKENYVILVDAWTTGMPAILSQNRRESYISQGQIVDGKLRPDVFVKLRSTDNYTKFSYYRFDYPHQKVYLHQNKTKRVTQTQFDTKKMKTFKEKIEVFEYSDSEFPYYTDNDLLSLFFNTQKILPDMYEGESKQLAAIGSKTKDCIIDIEVPEKEKKEQLQAIMADSDGKLLTIILHQDIFQSEKGELHVIFDKDGFAKNVLLKDVILFGDIRGTRTYQVEEQHTDLLCKHP